MGWLWGDEYSIQTSAVSGAFFDDEASGDPWKLIPLKAAMNDVNISRVVRQEIMVGLGAKIERAYNQASDVNQFAHGLLNHTILSTATGSTETKAYLESLHGESVSLEYHRMDSLNMAHVGHEYLLNTQGYSLRDNTSSVQSALQGFPVYVEHMALRLKVDAVSILEPASDLPEWEIPPNKKFVPWESPLVNSDSWSHTLTGASTITIHFAWLGPTPVTGTPTALDWAANGVPENAFPPELGLPGQSVSGYSFNAAYGLTNAVLQDFVRRYTISVSLSNTGYVQAQDYFQTKYFTNLGGTPVAHYFTHGESAGTIPSIENTTTIGAGDPTFFPLIFIRREFTTIADPANAETLEYQQNAAICKTIGFDYQEFANGLLEEADEQDLSQLFITFSIAMDTDKQIGLRYLYEFFAWLNLDNTDQASTNIHGGTQWEAVDPKAKKVLHFTDNSAHMRLEYLGTSTALKPGWINGTLDTEIGMCDSTLLSQEVSYPETRIVWTYLNKGGSYATVVTQVKTRTIAVWRYRKQVSSNRYREVLVAEPLLSYRLLSASGGDERFAYVADFENLLIPLNHETALAHFTTLERTQLYAESMHVQANAYVKTKLSWYETERFQVVMTIAAVVVVVVSLGTMTDTVYQVYTAIFAAIGSAAGAVVLTALFFIGIQIGLAKIFSLIVDEIGGKWGSIGAALLAVVAIIATAKGLPGADKWVMAANGFADAVQVQLEEDIIRFEQALVRLQDELEDFIEIRDEYENEMAIMERLLEATGLTSVHNTAESAEQFYARTVSGTEAATVAVNTPEVFLQLALRLPEY